MNEKIYYTGLGVEFHPENWLDIPEDEMYEVVSNMISEEWIKSKTPEYLKETIKNIYEFVRYNSAKNMDDYIIHNIGNIGSELEQYL